MEQEGTVEPDSCWKGTSQRKLEQAEKEMIELSGLGEEEIRVYKVQVECDQSFREENKGNGMHNQLEEDSEMGMVNPMIINKNIDPYTGKKIKPRKKRHRKTCCCLPCCCSTRVVPITKEYIMTYEFGNKSKPEIVLIHGFGGSALIFFKLFKRLSENYHVYAIDLLGMGRSSRPKFLARTKTEAEDYYICSIEMWRESLGLDNMNIVAHSFGAYITSRYALKYPDKVKKIVFWSPHGCEPKPEDYEQKLKERLRGGCCRKCMLKTMLFIFKHEIKPSRIIFCCGRCIGSCWIKNYVKRRFVNMTDTEKEVAGRYLYQLLMREQSGEKAIFKLMKMPILAYTPIYDELDKLNSHKIEISFVYGDRDWIDTQMGGTNVSQLLKRRGEKVSIIHDSDHHLYLDNPEDLLDSLDEEMQKQS
ncbi:unnamed protein product [Moneuplotes crassus]|uniref:AB hydrolase-1 domain-containing protein n=1 Tax=Euplotes crassus TaxID=5936 RepID=A0AAD1UN43_EUPCR|nr:unnamed protein product [Moneuplotes crassus]